MKTNELKVPCGCVFGILAGIAFAFLNDLVYWLSQKYIYQPSYVYLDNPLDFIMPTVVVVGFPVSLMIGIITYLHNAVFMIYNPNSLVWTAIIGLGTFAGLWFTDIYQHGFSAFEYVEVVLICLITSWLVHKLTLPKPKNNISESKRKFITSLISGSVFTFIEIYTYFAFLKYLMNIPS